MGADRLCASKEDAFWKLLELEAKWPYETFRLMTLDEWNKETAHDVQNKVGDAGRGSLCWHHPVQNQG